MQDNYLLTTDGLNELVASDALALTDLFITVDPTSFVPTKATGAQLATLFKSAAGSATATIAVGAADTGKMYVDTLGSGTSTFTLPAAAAGLEYTFVCGNASGEILITPAAGDAIVCKAAPHTDATAVAPAAGTGIKNTAATNVVGDRITLRAVDATTWYATSQAGTWASQ
jgi:hypothetical protein